jgi:uncharacterized membrane protein YqjE
MSGENQSSAGDLLGSVVSQISTLFRKEVQLARAEVGEKVSAVSNAATMIAIGGVLLLAALIILLHALVVFLAYAGIPVAWAQVIVFVVVGLIGYLVLRSGMNRLKASNLVPSRTAEQLSRDAAVVKEQVQ